MGHIPSALSILDIIWVLHDQVMTEDDQFILSKGHAVMALYVVLEAKGLLEWNTRLMGHPKRGGPIMASTGSLGHGLPMAVGLAKAKKIKGEEGRVFCIVGDGECNEGSIWEAAAIAAHHNLDNLVIIVDENHSSDRALNNQQLYKKFEAFGFLSFNVKGHDHALLEEALNYKCQYPISIIAQTIKGNGVSFMQSPEWHNKKLTQETYETAIL